MSDWEEELLTSIGLTPEVRARKERERLDRLAGYEKLHQFNVDELTAAGIEYRGHVITAEDEAGWDGSAPEGQSHGRAGKADMSPEAVAARAEAKRRHAEAVAFVAEYRGKWGLPLDIKARRDWGSKHLKLSEAQVDALLKGKAREAQWAEENKPSERQLEIATAALDVVKATPEAWNPNGSRQGVPEIVGSILAQHVLGRKLSDKQLEVIERWTSERQQPPTPQTNGLAPQRPNGSGMAGDIAEGFYLVGDQPWKVQWNKAHTGKYGLKLVVGEGARKGDWEFVSGSLRIIAAEGRQMTLEEAASYGKLTGVCVVCGARLTDPESIARGIGPICANKF